VKRGPEIIVGIRLPERARLGEQVSALDWQPLNAERTLYRPTRKCASGKYLKSR